MVPQDAAAHRALLIEPVGYRDIFEPRTLAVERHRTVGGIFHVREVHPQLRTVEPQFLAVYFNVVQRSVECDVSGKAAFNVAEQ